MASNTYVTFSGLTPTATIESGDLFAITDISEGISGKVEFSDLQSNLLSTSSISLFANNIVSSLNSYDDGFGSNGLNAFTTTSQGAIVTPYEYGAVYGEEESVDNSTYVQAMMDDCTSSWNSTYQSFLRYPSFAGKLWRCDSEIFVNELRQPNFRIFGFGGGIHSRNTNGVALNAIKTNQLFIHDLSIYGNPTYSPDVGIAYGRSVDGDIAPGVRLYGCSTRGNFNKSAGINIASEVGGHFGCYFHNQSPVRTAVAFAWVSTTSSIDNNLTGGSATLQGSFDVANNSTIYAGVAASNLGHENIGCDYKRASPVVISIVDISKSNPAVVTVSSSSLSSSNWTNGTEISLHDVSGMTELAGGIYTIANINTGAGTFQLSGVNSTTYETFVSGRAWQATGPAVLINGVKQFVMESAYLLAYNEVNHIIDMSVGSAISNFYMHFQPEASNDYTCEIIAPSSGSTAIIQNGFNWNSRSTSQRVYESIFKITGDGNLRFDGGSIAVGSQPEPYPTLFDVPTNISLWDFKVEVAVASTLNSNDSYARYDVLETAYNRYPRVNEYRKMIHYNIPTFRVEDGTLVAAKFESIDTLSSSDDDTPPYIDLFRDNEAAFAGTAGLGRVRFTGNNSANVSVFDLVDISNTNPVVVTVANTAAFASSVWDNGYKVIFNLDGVYSNNNIYILTGGAGQFTVDNINAVSGTFELLNFDGSDFEPFVSGTVRNVIETSFASVSGFVEDGAAYAEFGRLLFQAVVDSEQQTVGWANQYGLSSLGNRVQTGESANNSVFESVTSDLNTFNKYVGKMVWDTTNTKPVWSSGSASSADWVDYSGNTVYTPS